ncbi:MAG: thiamine phosphate synthase [Myxococcales bacterium]|nr:thiamine phosphate synthase [Myxococcales bacterium]
MRRVIQITDLGSVSAEEIEARARRGGPHMFTLLRDPGLSAREALRWGRRLRQVTRDVGGGLLVADRLDLAWLLEADGAHLGRGSVEVVDARRVLGEGAFVSRSAHDESELREAATQGADAALVSPIFASPGKGPPLGLAGLTALHRMLGQGARPRLYALGGVDRATAPACLSAGADGVASIRADLTAFAHL